MRAALALAAVAVCATALPAAGAETLPDLDVYVVDARGRVTDLTPVPALDTAPSPSPDGSRIAFVSSREGASDVYVMSASGGPATRLTSSPFDGQTVAWNEAGRTAIAWSPGGKRIAFDVQNATYPPDCFKNCVVWSVYVANADGSARRLVASQARSPAWSHDGRFLAYKSDVTPFGESESVSIDRLDGSPPRRIDAPRSMPYIGPAWSPRRDELAFDTGSRWVYSVRADGTGRHRLARGLGPAWSPDGGSIAFELDGTLYRMSRTGTRVRRLAPRAGAGFPAWSPGGRAIAFSSAPGPASPRIAVVSASGGRVLRLAPATGLDGGPAWLGRTGRLVYARCAAPGTSTCLF